MLQFENLCAGYHGKPCLHDISAALQSGKLTAIIGPNGCGKSTLLKCAAGLLKPMGGKIHLDGKSLSSLRPRELALWATYMPQSRLIPEISVGQLARHGRYPHLKWGQSLRTEDRSIVQEALRRTDMLDFADRPLQQLSGGERQRAYLAMMLAQQSPILLLDEPTAHLDLAAQFALMQLLRDLCAEGRCTAVVLHELNLALEHADEILLLQGGRLIAQGSPAEICASGKIEQVFGIKLTQTPTGYHFSPK